MDRFTAWPSSQPRRCSGDFVVDRRTDSSALTCQLRSPQQSWTPHSALAGATTLRRGRRIARRRPLLEGCVFVSRRPRAGAIWSKRRQRALASAAAKFDVFAAKSWHVFCKIRVMAQLAPMVSKEGAVESPPGVGSAPTYVVGIGASAGGLEALEHFFDNVPTKTGMAF